MWEETIKELTGMDFACSAKAAENRTKWKRIAFKSSTVPRRPRKAMHRLRKREARGPGLPQ